MTKGFYHGTGKRGINFEQGLPQKPEPETPQTEPVTFMLVPAERKPFVVPPQEYDKKALGDAMKAFFSERGNIMDSMSGPVRHQHGSTNQILAACLAYHAAASKAEKGE